MPDINPITSGITAGMGLMKSLAALIRGAKQNREAKKLAKTINRPNYDMPQSIQEAEAMQRNLANSGNMPGYTQAQQMIGANTANQLGNIADTSSSAAESLMAANAANNSANNSQLELDMKNAENKQNNLSALSAFLTGVKAPEERQKWLYNMYEPYQQKMKQYAALKNAAANNMQNAGTDAMQAVAGIGGASGGNNTSGVAMDNGLGTVPDVASTVSNGIGINPNVGNTPNIQNYASSEQQKSEAESFFRVFEDNVNPQDNEMIFGMKDIGINIFICK
jgi:hypothetical protein